jgi:nucleoside phosphorylase
LNIPKKITLGDARRLVDYAVITVKAEEFAAVLRRFPVEMEARGQTQYNVAHFNDESGTTRHVAIVKSWEQGDISAQSIANALVSDLEPRLILVVGIPGARPDREFTLGDVIVANRMFNFAVTAANPDGSVEFATRSSPAHRVAEIVASSLVADYAKYGDWQTETSIGMPRPPVALSAKSLRGSPEWRQRVREALGHYFGANGRDRQPTVLEGPIGSSSTLMKDPARFAAWLDKTREVKAVDMEISGVFEAARLRTGDLPVIVIRGISDVVGFKRDARWTDYACNSAAAFCHALLKSGVIDLDPGPRRKRPAFRKSREPTRKTSRPANAEDADTLSVTVHNAVEEWLLGLLRQSLDFRPFVTLRSEDGVVAAVVLSKAEFELLNAAAEIVRNPELLNSLRRPPSGKTLSLAEVFQSDWRAK